MRLRTLSLPIKVLFSCLLITIGIGYLFAILYLFLIDVEPHAKHGVGLVDAVILKYYGQRGATQLEAALDGAMGDNLTPARKNQVVAWVRAGATAASFAEVRPIFLENCAPCHNKESGLPIPPLTSHEEVSIYTEVDMGQSIKTLIRVSHIHLFGMSFIFMLTGAIFVLSEIAAVWRALLVAVPFVAIWLDIGSWLLTKFEPVFAYTVVIGGALMGLALAAQIAIALYEMWLKSPKDAL